MIRAAILLLLAPLAAFAATGGETESEFREAFAVGLAEIRANHADLAAQIPADFSLGGEARILVSEEPLLVPAAEGTQESVAVNEPATRTIWIHRARWEKAALPRLRQAIALHEALSLVGLEGTGRYPISAPFLNRFYVRGKEDAISSGVASGAYSFDDMRISCENKSSVRHIQTKRHLLNSGLRFNRYNVWRINEKTYAVSFGFGGEGKGPAKSKPLLHQVTEEGRRKQGAGSLAQVSYRMLTESNGYLTSEIATNETRYTERTGADQEIEYAWKNGRRGAALYHTTSREAGADSLRETSEKLAAFTLPGWRKEYVVRDCLFTKMSAADRISSAEELAIEADLQDLQARGRAFFEAERALQSCRPEECGARRHDVAAREADFVVGWNKLYETKLRDYKKRYGKLYTTDEYIRAGGRPGEARRSRVVPLSREGSGPKVTEPTMTYPNGKNGMPVLRMPGQSLYQSPAEKAAGDAMDAYFRRRGGRPRLGP